MSNSDQYRTAWTVLNFESNSGRDEFIIVVAVYISWIKSLLIWKIVCYYYMKKIVQMWPWSPRMLFLYLLMAHR